MGKKGQVIARIRDLFGIIIKEYKSPEDAIVIGKNSNPVSRSGEKMVFLGMCEQLYFS